jgi:hypothetical protein
MSFFTGFGVSAIIYYVVNILSPVPGKSSTWDEVDLSAEYEVEQIHHEPHGKEVSDGSFEAKV